MKQSKELQAAIKAAKAAGKILMQNFNKGITASMKTPGELVTPIDLKSEKKIISILRSEFPDYGILSEEAGAMQKESDCRWIIDPLDGTHNFFFGLPMFGVSIALEKKGAIQCGAIILPALNELYTAEKGKGTFLNGKRIKVSRREMKDSAITICVHMFKDPKNIDLAKQIAPTVFSTRVLGSSNFALAMVAAGRIDATVELKEKPWDLAAGWLLVEEAGGRLTGLNGEEMSLEKIGYIASSGVFHDRLVEITGASK